MKFSVALCAILITSLAQAQFIKDYRIEADKFYEKGDWQNAAINYEKYLTDKNGLRKENNEFNPYGVKGTTNKAAASKPNPVPKNVSLKLITYRIAECYRKLDNYKEAEPWYAKVEKESYPLTGYYHGVCLRALARYEEAAKEFNSFNDSYTTNDDYKKNAQAELKNLKFIIAQMKGKEQKLYVVKKMQDGINTTEHGQNTAPFVSNGTLYFTSSRPDTVVVKKQKKAFHNNNVFAYKAGSNPEKAGLPAAKDMHQGAAAITPDGKTIYFTRWATAPGSNAAIYMSNSGDGGNWSEPVKLAGDINVEGFSSKQPMVTSDGKYLLYSSNKPGGKGKFDIYYASLEGGKVGTSTAFAEPVNSENDEITPFYHVPSKQLVFSSAGRIGMGGYDLFSTKGEIGSNFSEPKNLGYPINSQKDEQYFYGGDEKFLLKNFYISSDRGSDCCLELYTANKLIKKWVTGRVVDSKTGAPVAGVNLNIKHDNGSNLESVTTDANGMYFVETDPYNKLEGRATKEKYEPSTQSITGDFNIDTLVRKDWALTPIPPPPPPVITEEKPLIVRFDYDSSVILPEYQESLDSLAAMMARDKDMKVEIGGYTDQKGAVKYNLNLSQKRADAAKEYLVSKYGTDASRLSTKAYGKCCPIEKETNEDGSDNEAARKVNRRLEFKMLKKEK